MIPIIILVALFVAPSLLATFRVRLQLTAGLVAASFIGIVLGIPAAICGPDFFFHFNADGRCAATDTPSEVFQSFLMLAFIFSGLSLLIATAVHMVRQ